MKKFELILIILCLGGLFSTVSCGISLSLKPSFVVEEESSPNWAPDGKRLVYECYLDGPTEETAEGNSPHYTIEAVDICTVDVDGHNRIHLTKDLGQDRYPVWSSNGSYIAYLRPDGIYVIHADGSNQRQIVAHKDAIEDIGPVTWAPNENKILFSAPLENVYHDIYIIEINTGTLTNLTEHNQQQDFSPIWTLDGTKIIFLASSWGNPEFGQVPSQLKVVNSDGSNEKVLYEEELFYNSLSASNAGQVVFSTYDLAQDNFEHLYLISLPQEDLTEIVMLDQQPRPAWDSSPRFKFSSLSPDGKYLAFEERGLRILDIGTGVIQEIPLPGFIEEMPIWSLHNDQIAVTTYEDPTGFYSEKHIYILNLKDNVSHPLFRKR